MNFIEVTDKKADAKLFINVQKIESVHQQSDMTCFLCVDTFYKNGRRYGVYTKELYTDIVKQIKEIIKEK